MAKSRPKKKTPSRGRHRLSSSMRMLAILLVFSIACSIFALVQPHSALLSREEIRTLVEEYARAEGIEERIPELEAIATVESDWKSEDVFQSSESLGLPPNSLSTEESVAQGVHYFAALLDKAAALGVDEDAVFQAYNFGSGYLDYVAASGGRHTRELAEAFSKEHANGEVVSYPNPIAVEANGGWRYNYGNMFYVDLIHQVLDGSDFSFASLLPMRLS